ncbi:replication associated protein [Lake Sarah-associated circular virus-40]|uniref:replication associated protein n=1 Tax=Lake Sarah-associated circular virus-40 TaxID=1685769 RepID=UPI0007775079|nr:replication associated protein [Lake Sarah-associated circular virus-40]ALE29769.1 replication associated protein [Lake Sarah-associated circular virus-40]
MEETTTEKSVISTGGGPQSSRTWCGTLNNYSQGEYEFLVQEFNKVAEYWIIGKEKGQEGTPHLQMACSFTRAQKLNYLKQNLSVRAHWEITKGTLDQNRVYCMKEGDYTEGGAPPVKKQGKRTDIEMAVETLKATGGDVQEMALTHPEAYVKYSSNFEKLAQRYQKKMRSSGSGYVHDRRVIWIYGPSGTGKTRYVHEKELISNLWISGRDLRWWQSYDMEPAVLFDDFRGDFCKYHELLRILDRYQCTVENKGGSVSLQNVKRIWITSCFHPRHVYDTREDIEQLIRRIDKIWHFTSTTKTDVTNEKEYPGKPGGAAPDFITPLALVRTKAVIPESPPTPTNSRPNSKRSSTIGTELDMVISRGVATQPLVVLDSDEEEELPGQPDSSWAASQWKRAVKKSE